MKTNLEQSRYLEAFLNEHVPLARAASIVVDHYDGQRLIMSAPLEDNINDKGTAFGGSLYNLCVVTGWGMTHLKAEELGLEGDLVIAKAEIEYLSPLKGRLVAEADAPTQVDLERFSSRFQSRSKAALSLHVEVKNELGEPCVRFSGKYAIVKSTS